jgi:hypothetical protein
MSAFHDLLSAVRGSLADYRRLLSLKDDLKTLPDNPSTREYSRILKEIELTHREALMATQVEKLTSEFVPEGSDTAGKLEPGPGRPYPQSHRYDQLSSKQWMNETGRPSWNGLSLGGHWDRKVKQEKKKWFL